MKTVVPIKPSEVGKIKQATIPDEVIEAFNELIVANWEGESAVFLQKDAVKLIAKRLKIRQDAIFDKGYLDVEALYRKQGWVVTYDGPGFNESYDATFKFAKK